MKSKPAEKLSRADMKLFKKFKLKNLNVVVENLNKRTQKKPQASPTTKKRVSFSENLPTIKSLKESPPRVVKRSRNGNKKIMKIKLEKCVEQSQAPPQKVQFNLSKRTDRAMIERMSKVKIELERCKVPVQLISIGTQTDSLLVQCQETQTDNYETESLDSTVVVSQISEFDESNVENIAPASDTNQPIGARQNGARNPLQPLLFDDEMDEDESDVTVYDTGIIEDIIVEQDDVQEQPKVIVEKVSQHNEELQLKFSELKPELTSGSGSFIFVNAVSTPVAERRRINPEVSENLLANMSTFIGEIKESESCAKFDESTKN